MTLERGAVPQADGSTLWHVKVGDMKMEELIELHTFFPNEITISAGDSIWFDFGMGGFHTVSFLSGGDLPPIFIPDPEEGTPTAGGPYRSPGPGACASRWAWSSSSTTSSRT